MQANPLLGVLLHAIGGFMAASFYIPLKKVRNWSWESYWLVQGIVSWLIVPWVVATITIPELGGLVHECWHTPSALWSFVFGMLWGIGGLTFGLSMRYLGMSLGYALALGFCAAFGTMIPPLAAGHASTLFGCLSGWITVGGVAVCLAGIVICAFAGTLKDRELTMEQKRAAITEFALTKGVLVAIFSGIMSACMAFGLDAGTPIADMAASLGAADILKNNAVLVFVLAGGFTTNFIWCVILNLVNGTGGDYGKGPGLANLGWCALGGTTWYLQFFFYGMGTTKLGQYNFASWTIHMAFIIAFSNLWGLVLREWKGSSRRVLNLVYGGIAVLVLSTVVVGVGNYVKARADASAPPAAVRRPPPERISHPGPRA
jgi:L-rhamnose-H+ transport protein